jgi:hypothetical protein
MSGILKVVLLRKLNVPAFDPRPTLRDCSYSSTGNDRIVDLLQDCVIREQIGYCLIHT